MAWRLWGSISRFTLGEMRRKKGPTPVNVKQNWPLLLLLDYVANCQIKKRIYPFKKMAATYFAKHQK